MQTNNQSIVIVGAGIAGLSAALALAQKGFSVLVYEKVSALQEVGAGVQLAPNATRILKEWGVLDSILQCAVEPEDIFLIDGMNGRILLDLPIHKLAKQRWNGVYLTIHRADLQNKLYEAAQKHPLIDIHLDYGVIGAAIISDHVEVDFEHKNKKLVINTPVLVGCDGVWSTLRRLGENEDPAAFTGYIAWRATIDSAALPASFLKVVGDKPNVSAWMGPENHLVAYPLQSGKAYNFVAITHGENPGETWSKTGDRTKLFHTFRAWHPVMRDIVMSTEDWTYWPLFGMAHHQFLRGPRQAYVGDAAHAFLPFAAQGAVMAIEDAAALAQALSQNKDDINEALALYNRVRLPRVAAVNKRGIFNSRVYHATGPIAFGRNLMMKMRSTDHFAAGLDWLYNYDATAFGKTAEK